MHESGASLPRYVIPGRLRALLMVFTFATVLAVAMACGSGDEDEELSGAADAGATTGEGEFPILTPDRVYTVDDLVAAGWKKSKQYPTETVPGALDIWYGFFNQKDIEVRFYESHDAATTLGKDLADEAVGRKLRQGGQVGASNRGAGGTGVTRYEAYIIAGNTVMLCELAVETCTELLDGVTGS